MYISVWEVRKPDKGNYLEGRVSMSSKNKQTGEYDQTFSDGYVHFIGKASETLQPYVGMSSQHGPILRANIPGFSVQNCYKGDDGKLKYNKNPRYSVFELEVTGGNNAPQTQSRPSADSFMNVPDTDSEELPFE